MYVRACVCVCLGVLECVCWYGCVSVVLCVYVKCVCVRMCVHVPMHIVIGACECVVYTVFVH